MVTIFSYLFGSLFSGFNLLRRFLFGVKMTDIKSWTAGEPYLNIHCALGEGPYYVKAAHKLRFVDIKKHRLHVVDLTAGPDSVETIELGQPVGVTADIEGVDPTKKILVGAKTGLSTFEWETGKLENLKAFYDGKGDVWDDRMRSNDGTVDSEGRMWVATMNDFHVGSVNPEGTSKSTAFSYLFAIEHEKDTGRDF
jgi:sugar lactone lactonase YvrE